MSCRNLSMPTMTRFTRRQARRPRELPTCHMEEDGGNPGASSRRESDISGGGARPHQQREDAICLTCQTEFQHGDIQGRESIR